MVTAVKAQRLGFKDRQVRKARLVLRDHNLATKGLEEIKDQLVLKDLLVT